MKNQNDEQLPKESKGLGDTIAKITEAIGLDVVSEKVANALGQDDCGCKKRQQKLNEMFPYDKKE